MKKEFKAITSEVTEVDEETGIVKAIFSVMGNVDLGFDRVHNGAFKKTFDERGDQILVLDQHNTGSVNAAIAKTVGVREVGRDELPKKLLERFPEATGGAEITAKFAPDDDDISRRAFFRIQNGWVNQWSFGYEPLDYDYTDEKIAGEDVRVRNLRTLKLYEVSPVLWGMNPATTTTGAKSAEGKPWDVIVENGEYCVYRVDENGDPVGDARSCYSTREEAEEQVRALYANVEENSKGASGSTTLSLSDRKRSWDASAAKKRVASLAGGPDKEDISWSEYAKAFFWKDPDNSDNFGGYKLPFADVVDGKLVAIWGGVKAAAGAVQGARSELDVPDSDLGGIKSRIAKYYAKARSQYDDDDIEVPWSKMLQLRKQLEALDDSIKEHIDIESILEKMEPILEDHPGDGDSLNLSQLVEDVRSAFHNQFNAIGTYSYWAVDVYTDYIIACYESEDGLTHYKIPYTRDEENDIVFSSQEEWVEGELVFKPLSEEGEEEQEEMGTDPTITKTVELPADRVIVINIWNAPLEDGAALDDKEDATDRQAGPEETPPTSDQELLDIQKELIETRKELTKLQMED